MAVGMEARGTVFQNGDVGLRNVRKSDFFWGNRRKGRQEEGKKTRTPEAGGAVTHAAEDLVAYPVSNWGRGA